MRLEGQPWNKETLFARLEEICSPEEVQAARRLYSFAAGRGATFDPWNIGEFASATARFRTGKGKLSLFAIEEWFEGGKHMGKFVPNFGYLVDKLPEHVIDQLYETLCKIPDIKKEYEYVDLKGQGYKKRRGLSLEILTQPGALEKVLQAFDDLLQWGI